MCTTSLLLDQTAKRDRKRTLLSHKYTILNNIDCIKILQDQPNNPDVFKLITMAKSKVGLHLINRKMKSTNTVLMSYSDNLWEIWWTYSFRRT